MRVAPKLSDDRFFSAAYGLADVANDVFSIFVFDQVLVFNQIGDRLFRLPSITVYVPKLGKGESGPSGLFAPLLRP